MEVIICDIDGTVLDVTPRIAACLAEIGVDGGSDPSSASDELKGAQRNEFFRLFLSNRYLKLDEPIVANIELIRTLKDQSNLPLVYLSGRVDNMRKQTQAALDAIGIEYKELIVKSFRERMQRTAKWKVTSIQQRNYEPLHIFDDDAVVLAALGEAFPGAALHDLSGAARSSPGGG